MGVVKYYSRLIGSIGQKDLGYVKVTQLDRIDEGKSIVTMDGNHYFVLFSAGCEIRPIRLSEDLLLEVGFSRDNSCPLLDPSSAEVVFRKIYKNGWLLDLLFDGKSFFYLEPSPQQPLGYKQHRVMTVEQLQREVAKAENKEFILPLLDAVLNKQVLQTELAKRFSGRFICEIGPCNGNYVDNDPDRPDYMYLRLDPINQNNEPATIGLNHFHAKGCTISIRIQDTYICYSYGCSFEEVTHNNPQADQIVTQYLPYLRDLFVNIDESIENALIC